jgi:hypothetical protein
LATTGWCNDVGTAVIRVIDLDQETQNDSFSITTFLAMKNLSTTAKFEITKKVVARFARTASTSGRPYSSSATFTIGTIV